ncbi:MAG: hypothetical protein MZU95_04850 [Desulfomicrobium escambiense]|nr:hypothetical protein [Desulfomicrobium escambiense]
MELQGQERPRRRLRAGRARPSADFLLGRGARVTGHREEAGRGLRRQGRDLDPPRASPSRPAATRPESFLGGRPHRPQPRRPAASPRSPAARERGVPVLVGDRAGLPLPQAAASSASPARTASRRRRRCVHRILNDAGRQGLSGRQHRHAAHLLRRQEPRRSSSTSPRSRASSSNTSERFRAGRRR